MDVSNFLFDSIQKQNLKNVQQAFERLSLDWEQLFKQMDEACSTLFENTILSFLHFLLCEGSFEVIEFIWEQLIQHGYPFDKQINREDPINHVPLKIAVCNKRLTDEQVVILVEKLLDKGANPDFERMREAERLCSFIQECLEGRPLVYKLLVDRDEATSEEQRKNFLHKANYAGQFTADSSALHILCAGYLDSKQHRSILFYLIEQCPETLVKKSGTFFCTPLTLMLRELKASSS